MVAKFGTKVLPLRPSPKNIGEPRNQVPEEGVRKWSISSKESTPKSCVSFFVLGSEDSKSAFSVTEAVSSVNEEASSVIEAAFLISETASSVSLHQVFIKGVNVNYSGFH